MTALTVNMIYVLLALMHLAEAASRLLSLRLTCLLLRGDNGEAARAVASHQCAFLSLPCVLLYGHEAAYSFLCTQCPSPLSVYFFSGWALGALPVGSSSLSSVPSGSAFFGWLGLCSGLIFGLS